MEEDNMLIHSTRLFSDFKNFLNGQSQISVKEYPPDFLLKNYPVNQIEERGDDEPN